MLSLMDEDGDVLDVPLPSDESVMNGDMHAEEMQSWFAEGKTLTVTVMSAGGRQQVVGVATEDEEAEDSEVAAEPAANAAPAASTAVPAASTAVPSAPSSSAPSTSTATPPVETSSFLAAVEEFGGTTTGADFLSALKASDPEVGNPVIGNHHALGPRGMQSATDASELHDSLVQERLDAWAVHRRVSKAIRISLRDCRFKKSDVKILTNLLEEDGKRDMPVYGLADPTVPGRGKLLETFRTYLPDDDITMTIVDGLLANLKVDADDEEANSSTGTLTPAAAPDVPLQRKG
jgi:hypothetical protein